MQRDLIVKKLDNLFKITDLASDPAMSRFIPMVYDPIGFPWKNYFDSKFTTRFNGLMLKGADQVQKIWGVSFPSDEVMNKILEQASFGDMIFAHHPVNMECGDPRGKKGKGFLPINIEILNKVKEKKLSFYSCHAPLDYNEEISTSGAIVSIIKGVPVGKLLPCENGYSGILCEIAVKSTNQLIDILKNRLGLLYVDLIGVLDKQITKVGVIAGGAGNVNYIIEAEKNGADCLIAGEVTSKIDNERGLNEQIKIEEYLPKTKMSIIGLSHAGSEYLVITDQLIPYFINNFGIKAEAVPEDNWWR